jgi:hypothetical protein
VTVTRDPANNAREVTFPSDVSKCAIMLTRVAGPPGSHARVINRPSGASVRVWTTIVDGGNATTRTDAFDIAAFC